MRGLQPFVAPKLLPQPLETAFVNHLIKPAAIVVVPHRGQTLVATRLDGRRDDLVVSARNRQQDEDLRTLVVVLSQFATKAEAPLEWC